MTLARKKELILVIVSAIFTLFYFLFVGLLIRGNVSVLATGFWVVVIGIGWVALEAFAMTLVRDSLGFVLFHHLFAPFIAFLVGGITLSSWIGALLLGIFFYIARRRLLEEMNNRIRFKTHVVFYPGLRLIVFGMMITIVTLSLPSIKESLARGTVRVPVPYVQALLVPFQPIVERYVPGYVPGYTINEIINDQIQQQEAQLPAGFQIPPGYRETALRQLSNQFGVPLTGAETIPDVMASMINNTIRQVSQREGPAVVFGIFVLSLLILRTFVFAVAWPAVGIISLLIQGAKRIGFAYISTSEVRVERLHI